ncbi:hypothetical protein M426DRAFT_9880 [Hypoxylon sp. CI-4A]|nr:hypothetical protein M426DRAFT_9880 [Hypoxylon sp. CI-4A]
MPPCQYCSGLSIKSLVQLAKTGFKENRVPGDIFYPHHHSLGDLEQAAQNGCDLCRLILDSSKRLPAYDRYPMKWYNKERNVEHSIFAAAKELSHFNLEISIDTDIDRTDTRDRTDLVDCKFRSVQETATLFVHMEKGRNTTLSHCWGGKITPLLTTETLSPFQHNLPYCNLPANFQDAITITREMGIQYLWIDSLCIMQDSNSDWEHEFKKMDLVYRDATLTISALASKGSTRGILANVPKSEASPHPVLLKCLSDSGDEVDLKITMLELDREDLLKLHKSSPLSSRGWTLQESVLSPRQLFYGASKIYWKCLEGYKGADDIPPGARYPDELYEELSPILFSDSLTRECSRPYNVPGILHDYSHRKLTFDRGKLPAFSGIAQLLHPAIGGDYVAGIWSRDIRRGLMWYAEKGRAKHV